MPRVQMPSLYERLASIHKPPTSICATQEAKARRKYDSAAGPAWFMLMTARTEHFRPTHGFLGRDGNMTKLNFDSKSKASEA